MNFNEMSAYGQGCFEQGYERGLVIGARDVCRRVIINLLKESHSYTFIEDITSCSAAQIDALAKEQGLKPGNQENAGQASNSHS